MGALARKLASRSWKIPCFLEMTNALWNETVANNSCKMAERFFAEILEVSAKLFAQTGLRAMSSGKACRKETLTYWFLRYEKQEVCRSGTTSWISASAFRGQCAKIGVGTAYIGLEKNQKTGCNDSPFGPVFAIHNLSKIHECLCSTRRNKFCNALVDHGNRRLYSLKKCGPLLRPWISSTRITSQKLEFN